MAKKKSCRKYRLEHAIQYQIVHTSSTNLVFFRKLLAPSLGLKHICLVLMSNGAGSLSNERHHKIRWLPALFLKIHLQINKIHDKN